MELSRMQPPKSKIKYSKATMATRKCNCAHSVTRPFFSSIFILVHRPCASNFYVNRHEAGNCVCVPVVPIGSLFFIIIIFPRVIWRLGGGELPHGLIIIISS